MGETVARILGHEGSGMSRVETFPMVDMKRAEDWVGRTEEAWGKLTPQLAGMLKAAVGHPSRSTATRGCSALLPRLWHWAAFPRIRAAGGTGRGRAPEAGRFLPPLAFKRRMWAAGRLSFHGSLRIGERLRRTSSHQGGDAEIGRHGRHGLRHRRARDRGRERRLHRGGAGHRLPAHPRTYTPPKRMPEIEAPDFDETVPVNEARLFRFSAATYNAHRIHYDLPYAQEVEKYPALVVHGPMQAIMLIDAATRHAGEAPKRFGSAACTRCSTTTTCGCRASGSRGGG
jgi:3-methylfumaryl-CoA hydratase